MNLIAKISRTVDALAEVPYFRERARAEALEAFVSNRDENMFYGVHESWKQASNEAAKFGKVGYDDDASAVIYDHLTRIDTHDYPALCWLMRSMHDGLHHVGDVGGSIGIKYLAFRDALSTWQELRWRVNDVPAVVEHGRKLSAERGDSDRLSFVEKIDELQGCDVLYASGVLQYLPEALGETLSNWQQRPKRIIINTTPIHPVESFFTVNSIGTAFCPYRVQTQAELVRGLTKLGYKVRESWINPNKLMEIPMYPDHSLQHYSGFCLDQKRR